MFTVSQEIENLTAQPATLYPYGRVLRIGLPVTTNNYLLHEGLLGVFDKTLTEVDYADLMEEEKQHHQALDRRLARHHRQILGRGRDPAPGRQDRGFVPLSECQRH